MFADSFAVEVMVVDSPGFNVVFEAVVFLQRLGLMEIEKVKSWQLLIVAASGSLSGALGATAC